jgi:hypothetical protein
MRSNLSGKTSHSTSVPIDSSNTHKEWCHGIKRACSEFLSGSIRICNELPKLPLDISIVKVVRSGITGTGENISTALTVNRHKIISALKWLKQHNPL